MTKLLSLIASAAIRVAKYSRKSTEQEGMADEARSVARQDRLNSEFISRQGWPLDEGLIYIDDGVSGSSFERPAFQRMLQDAKAGLFDVLVVFDQDRLSRADEVDTMVVVRELADNGVTVYESSTGQPIAVDSWGGAMTYLKALVNRQQVEQVRKHTSAGLRAKAQRGEPLGPPPYGYKTVIIEGEGGRTSRNWAIDPAQKVLALKILTRLGAEDWRYSDVCEWLNGEHIPSKRGGQWQSPTLRQMLRNHVYRGWVICNKEKVLKGRETGKPGRTRMQVRRPESEWTKVHRPDLRIISDELAVRIDARISRDAMAVKSAPDGRAPWRSAPQHLLTGLLKCPDCGGNFTIRPGRRKVDVYGCGRRAKYKGTCSCWITLPLEETERAVVTAVEQELRGGTAMDSIIEELLARREAAPNEAERREAEKARLLSDINSLLESSTTGISARLVQEKVREREEQLARLEALPVQAVPVKGPTSAELQKRREELHRKAESLLRSLRADTRKAQRWLHEVLGPITIDWDTERDEPVWLMLDPSKTDGFPFSVAGPHTGLIAWSAELQATAFHEPLVNSQDVENSPT